MYPNWIRNCACCRESTRDRLFNQGLRKLKHEVEISSILRNLRIVKAAVKIGFSQKEWRNFKEKNAIRMLYLDEPPKYRQDTRLELQDFSK